MREPVAYWLIATGFGSGAAPRAPGTVGSLVALLIVVALDQFLGFPWWGTGALAIGAAVLNVMLGPWIEREMGKDPPAVVIDEFAGQWLALTVPIGQERSLWVYVAGFVLFRFFDILKPLGADALQRLPHGWGVLMDDVLAGAYSLAIITAGFWVLQSI